MLHQVRRRGQATFITFNSFDNIKMGKNKIMIRVYELFIPFYNQLLLFCCIYSEINIKKLQLVLRNTSKRSRTSTRQGEGTWPRLRMANGEWRITLDSPFRYTSVCVPVQSVTLTNYHMMNYQKNNQSNRQINNSEFLH